MKNIETTERGNEGKEIVPYEHSCINCKNYYFTAPQHDQPYPEFTCTKGHWSGIGSKEEYNELFDEIDCDDFTPTDNP